MSKPFKGEIHSWWIKKFEKPSRWENVTLHEGLVHMAFGHRNGTTLMHTSPIVQYQEIPRHQGDPRKIEIETENSLYLLIGDPIEDKGFADWRL